MTAEAPLVVVGGGLVAANLSRQLRRNGFAGRIVVVSDEAEAPYDRPPLSKQLLAGTMAPEDTRLLKPQEIEDLGVELVLGATAERPDILRRTLVLAEGRELRYDRLVVATGARARRLPGVPELTGVHHLRSLGDSAAIAAALRQARRLVVLGAGFIGLEVAAVARSQGLDVTVVETAARPLTRVLGPDAGQLVTELHEERGVRLRCSTTVTEVRGEDCLAGVVLDGVEFVPADLLLVGVGAVPNTEWLSGSGLEVDDGVVCDASGRTSDPHVFAAGDVSRWRNALTGAHVRVEQWQSALEQAIVLADVLTGSENEWASVPYFWSDQYDRKIQFCGAAGPVSDRRETARGPVVCFGDDAGRLVGVLTLSNPRALAQGRRLVAAGASWAEAREWTASL